MSGHLRLGTRGSALALTQSRWVAAQLEAAGWGVSIEVIRTTGDRITDIPIGSIGVKGLFVSEIEQALLAGEVDLAVHSMKDLPGEMPDELMIGAVPAREDARDVLIGRTAPTLDLLPPGATIGTSSARRRLSLLRLRPDLSVVEMRGNLDTRLRKLDEGQYDAICLAAAGMNRLGWGERITQYFHPDEVMPAVGQGALAVQIRREDSRVEQAVSVFHNPPTAMAVRAERAVMIALGGGCAIPLGAHGNFSDGVLTLSAVLFSADGHRAAASMRGGEEPEKLGELLARELITAIDGKNGSWDTHK